MLTRLYSWYIGSNEKSTPQNQCTTHFSTRRFCVVGSSRFPTGRVISGEPLAKPPVVSLCCQVGRQVVDKFGPGVSQSQAGGLVEALVARLALGMGTGEASKGWG